MKKIDKMVRDAVKNFRPLKSCNTEVTTFKFCNIKTTDVHLHGHLIFVAVLENGHLRWHSNHCGWETATTKARINACLEAVGSEWRVVIRKRRFLVVGPDGKPAPDEHQFNEGELA